MRHANTLSVGLLCGLGFALAARAETLADHPHYWGDGWGSWGMMVFGPLMMIVFVAVVVVVAVLVIRWLGQGAGGPAPSPSGRRALDLLDERFARGEIDREEYLQKKQDLS